MFFFLKKENSAIHPQNKTNPLPMFSLGPVAAYGKMK
jgi:hypothetical protein